MVYNFFDKKSALRPDKSLSVRGVNIDVKPSEQLPEELHKLVIRKFQKRSLFCI